MMILNEIKARLYCIGPTQLGNLGKGARRLLEDDMPKLIALAEAAIKYVEDQPAVYRGELDSFVEALNAD